jgi:predicted nucleic acid-binding protein
MAEEATPDQLRAMLWANNTGAGDGSAEDVRRMRLADSAATAAKYARIERAADAAGWAGAREILHAAGTVVLDASAVLTWTLRESRWEAVDEIIAAPAIRAVLPAPAVTEVIYRARAKGNRTGFEDFVPALTGVGIQIRDLAHPDLSRAAELHELSYRHPGPPHPYDGKRPTLSLADSLILAVAERLDCPVLSRDRYWEWMRHAGLIAVRVEYF